MKLLLLLCLCFPALSYGDEPIQVIPQSKEVERIFKEKVTVDGYPLVEESSSGTILIRSNFSPETKVSLTVTTVLQVLAGTAWVGAGVSRTPISNHPNFNPDNAILFAGCLYFGLRNLYFVLQNVILLSQASASTVLVKLAKYKAIQLELTPQGIYTPGYPNPVSWEDCGGVYESVSYINHRIITEHYLRDVGSNHFRRLDFLDSEIHNLKVSEISAVMEHYRSMWQSVPNPTHLKPVLVYEPSLWQKLYKHKRKIALAGLTAAGSFVLVKGLEERRRQLQLVKARRLLQLAETQGALKLVEEDRQPLVEEIARQLDFVTARQNFEAQQSLTQISPLTTCSICLEDKDESPGDWLPIGCGQLCHAICMPCAVEYIKRKSVANGCPSCRSVTPKLTR